VVCKPSELTPETANLLCKVIDEVGLPAGAFNLVHGYGKGKIYHQK
jgi:aminomuconate-semialdehyde/2-hydroxymuconate-6-semialdehyde dehydrogenase